MKEITKTSNSVREIWRVDGKYQINGTKVQNVLYGYSGNPLRPYDDDTEPMFCIFTTINTNGTETGYLFTNKKNNGIYTSVRLIDFIEGEGKKRIFYSKEHRAHTSDKIELWDLLYHFRYGTTLEQAKKLNVRMIDKEPCMWFGGVKVFDLTFDNLISDEMLSAKFISGNGDKRVYGEILRRENTTCVYLPDRKTDECTGDEVFVPKYYVTSFCPELVYVLNRITDDGAWGISYGALNVKFSKSLKDPVTVSYAEIVGTFYRGKIDLSRPIDSIIANHSKLMHDEKIVFDHLTHNKENNFPWALAPITDTLNKQMQARDKIKPPYFFFTVYDPVIDKYKLKFGIYGLWERRYLFEDLACRNSEDNDFSTWYKPADDKPGKDSLYATIYSRFKDKIGDENMKAKLSYLSYWADIERALSSDNMYTAMLHEPVETYRPALEAWVEDGQNLDDMPEI